MEIGLQDTLPLHKTLNYSKVQEDELYSWKLRRTNLKNPLALSFSIYGTKESYCTLYCSKVVVLRIDTS